MENLLNEVEAAFDPAALAVTLVRGHVADNVDALNALSPEAAAAVLSYLPSDRAIDILDQPELDAAPEVVRHLPADQVAPLLSGMAADRAADARSSWPVISHPSPGQQASR